MPVTFTKGTRAASAWPRPSKFVFQCKPFNGKVTGEENYSFSFTSILPYELLANELTGSGAHKEVQRRMFSSNPEPIDLVMRECVDLFKNDWITLEAIYSVATRYGVALSPFRPWVLYTCNRTFKRAHVLHDVPWGYHLPYFVMSMHSPHRECMFRVSPTFLQLIHS